MDLLKQADTASTENVAQQVASHQSTLASLEAQSKAVLAAAETVREQMNAMRAASAQIGDPQLVEPSGQVD